jgi:DNA-binding transcriptional LysR family regulator
MDQLRAMRTFAAVAEHRGFAAAARALDLAPSVVTRQVAELEAHLGARLLTRSTRRVTLTPIGQRYLARVQGIVHEVQAAEAAVYEGQRLLRGVVRLVAPPLFACRQLLPVLARLHLSHPQIGVDIDADGDLSAPSDGHDISIVESANALDGDFVAYRLVESPVLLCAAPSYLRQQGQPLHPHMLAQHRLLLSAQTGAGLALTHASGARVTVQPEGVQFRCANAQLQHAAALAGMGIAALPALAVQEELVLGRLEPVLADWRLFELGVLACIASRHVPAVVRVTLDFLRVAFGTDNRSAQPEPSRLRLAA